MMESLDDFGVKKIIHKEQSDVDTSDSQRQKTISDSNSPDRITVMNKNNYKLCQPITTSGKSVNVKNKKIKKISGPSSYHPQKKQRNTSKLFLRPSKKRPHPTDHENESPSNKHCKSCTCDSTMIFKNKQNNLFKSKGKTEIDLYDNSVTAATNHIFNKSDKTQVAKEMGMKNIPDKVDPISYTSFENVKEKKEEFEEHIDKCNVNNYFVDSVVSISSTLTSKSKEIQPAVTSILSVASSTTPISSTTLLTTPLVQSITPLMFDFQPSESKPIKEKGNTNKTHLQFSFANPIVSTASSNETNHKLIYKVNANINPTHESINDTFTFKMPTNTKNTVILNSNKQHKLFDSNQPAFTFKMPEVDKKQSTPVIQSDAAKINDIQPTPLLLFRTTKESENTTSTPSLFGNNQKSIKKSTKPVQFKFCSSKPDNVSVPLPMTEPKNIVFRSSNVQNQNPFEKMDNMSSTAEKSTLKLQFSAMPTSLFGTSNMNQSKHQLSTSVSQSIDNQVFDNQISKNKQTTSGSDMCFANNLTNSVFQFNDNNSNSKPNDKVSEMPINLFTFSSTQTASIFQASAPQHSGDKPVYQQNAQKIEQSRTQFSTPTFGSQSTTTTPFNFGGDDKHVSSGSTFPFSNQPIQFTNNAGKKFDGVVPSSNTFQLSSNKANNNQVKFDQTSNMFPSMPKFSGTESSTPQQTTTFSSIQPSQFSPFDSVASPTSNSFVTHRDFQFANSNIAPGSSSTFFLGRNSQPTVQDDTFSFNVPSTIATTSPFQLNQTASAIIPTPQLGLPSTQGGAFSFVSPPVVPNGIVYAYLFNPPVARPGQPFLQLLYYNFF